MSSYHFSLNKWYVDVSVSVCLQSLLCGPSLSVNSVVPLLERLSEDTLWSFSLHLLCSTRRGQYESSIEKLLDRCPQAIIAYANHHLQDKNMVCSERSLNIFSLKIAWTTVFSLLYDFSWSDCFPLCITSAGVVVAEASPWTLWQDESSSRQQHPVSCPQRYSSPWTLTSQMMTWNSFVESHLWLAEWRKCLLEFIQERNLDKDRIFNSS